LLGEKVLRRAEGTNPLHARAEDLLQVDPTFLAALEELLGGRAERVSDSDIRELSAHAAAALVEKMHAVNQFIQVDRSAQNALCEIYRRSWQKIVESRDIESTLRTFHFPRIRSFLNDRCPPGPGEGLQSSPEIGTVPCSECSPELQVKLLRLDPSTVRQPLLDVGCGARAHLVTFLRCRQVEAFGMDRMIAQKSPYLNEMDWFVLRPGLNKWGTIVSNLAFSNHFVYAERYDPARVDLYRKKYMEILNSLVIGGSFVYAPGAAGLEAQAGEDRFKTETWSISGTYSAVRVTRTRR
jgi:hypothetical protein